MTRPAEAFVLDASVAPSIILLEVASAIAVAAGGQRPRLQRSEGRQAIEKFLQVGLATFPDDSLILPAYDLVDQLGCAIYDALYLALAQRLSIRLITADRRFYRMVQQLPEVLWIGAYAPAV